MKLAAMKRQAGRPKSNSGQNDQNLIGTVSRDVLAEQVGESSKQIQRYIRLTELIPELLDLVDNKKLQFTVAVDISYIDKEVQGWIYEYICDTGFIKPKQIAALRNQLNDGPINQIQMLSIFNIKETDAEYRKDYNAKGYSYIVTYEDETQIRYLMYDRDNQEGTKTQYVYYKNIKSTDGSWSMMDAEILDMYQYDYESKEVKDLQKTSW